VRLGSHRLALARSGEARPDARLELGVRPEHIRLVRDGDAITSLPARITRVDDAGRQKIVRAATEGGDFAVIVADGVEIPAEPRLIFDPGGLHLYADSWRVAGAEGAR
jgi:glycerol transport system ATP-binding protein